MSKLDVTPGRFYRDRAGHVWCCFSAEGRFGEHAARDCIRVADKRIEYFYQDGRYDSAGEREHTLILEVTYDNKDLSNDNQDLTTFI